MTSLSTQQRPRSKPSQAAAAKAITTAKSTPRPKPTRKKSSKSATNGRLPVTPVANGEVLTLSETAALLRVSEQAIEELVSSGELPARRVSHELRFSKSAVMSWLATPSRPQGNAAFITLAGAFKDDPYLDEMVDEIYRQRGRPIVEPKT